MAVGIEDIHKLSDIIEAQLKNEFSDTVSGNLLDSIKIELNGYGGVSISIDAEKYNRKLWDDEKVLVPDENGGSYASIIDEAGTGGGKHQGYLEKIINSSLDIWLESISEKFTLLGRGG